MPRMNYYPVIHPDGTLTKLECSPNELYDHIVQLVGSPFDHAVFGYSETEGGDVRIEGYIRDNGLFDGSLPNVLMALNGLPVCGPVMLTGGADYRGDTLQPDDCEALRSLISAAEAITEMHAEIDRRRESPFTLVAITSFDELEEMLGGGDDNG